MTLTVPMVATAEPTSGRLHEATRRSLEEDRPYERLRGTPLERELLDDATLERTLAAMLAAHDTRDGAWVFAYGSLIWNPAIVHDDRQHATLHGFHRRFCLRSRLNRGTPERPGIVLALERGGSCHGVAYHVPGHAVAAELRLLWKREMMLQSYVPRWLSARVAGGPVRALAFVVNHASSGYAGRLTDDEIVSIMAGARGRFGPGIDYLRATLSGLSGCGIRDPHLERIDRVARARGL